MSKLKTLMIDLNTLVGGLTSISSNSISLGKNTPYSLYPCMSYNVINSNTTRMPSFSSRSETFQVQFSVFDDNASGTDLIDVDEELESALTNSIGHSSNHFQEVSKQSMIGPRYLQDQKYWQLISLYNITICEEK